MSKKIVIIGAGPGGESAAKQAAKKGAQVTLVEKGDLGGVCLNCGCIPSKTLLEAGRLLHQVRCASGYCVGHENLKVQWDLLQKRKTTMVSSLRSALHQNLTRLGVRIVPGCAGFASPHKLQVQTLEGEETILFDAAVIATGSQPFFPQPFHAFHNDILDNKSALNLSHIPARVTIVGGGAIGCEFACLFHEFGSQVTLIEKTQGLLPGEDPAVVRVLQSSFAKRGIKVLTGVTVTQVTKKDNEWHCQLSDNSIVMSDDLLVCAGRSPVSDGLGLDKASIKTENRKIAVGNNLQTSQQHIYAVGDINGLSLLAHAASMQAEAAVSHIMGEKLAYQNDLVPKCLYTWPEVASVGENLESAQAKGVTPKSQRFFFQASPKAMAGNDTEGLMQVISDKSSPHRILGAQIAGPHATELIHVFSVGLRARMTLPDLREVIFAHPTLSEGIREAILK